MKKDYIRIKFPLSPIKQLFMFISNFRKRQLGGLLILQTISGASEIFSLGALLPFLSALSNPESMLRNPEFTLVFQYFNISSPSELIITLAIIFSVSIIFSNLIRLITLRTQLQLSASIGSELSTILFEKMLHQSYGFHINNNTSSMISEVVNDLNGTLSIIYNILSLVTQVLVILFIISTLLFINPIISLLLSLVIGASYVIILRFTNYRLHKNSNIIANCHVKLVQTLQESFGGIRDVLINGSQKTFVEIFRNADVPMRVANMDNQFLRVAPRFVLESIGICLISIITVFIAWGTDDFREALPIIGAISLAANRLLPAVQTAYASVAGIQGSQASLGRTMIGLNRQIVDFDVNPAKIENFALRNCLLLDDVSFHYGSHNIKEIDKNWTLKNITLSIPAFTTTALVGQTGSGKSTIADIVLGLLNPQQGSLIVDSKCLSGRELRAWQTNVAHVPQSIYLNDGNFIENIAFGVPVAEIDIERVHTSAKMACISEFIESRNNGYNEIVGERGIRLSGGQRQRIGIARALYKNASLIIFDEATSALDNETEREVMQAIRGLSGKVTILLIAHRISTVRHADCIYELGAGRIIHSGNFQELVEKSLTFRSMLDV